MGDLHFKHLIYIVQQPHMIRLEENLSIKLIYTTRKWQILKLKKDQ